MTQRGGRVGFVGQRVFLSIGIGPSASHSGIVHAVGGKDAVAVVCIRIGIFVFPYMFVIVDVENHESAARQVSVPSLLLTILQNIILVGIGIVAYHVGHGFVAEGRHIGDGRRFRQFLYVEPSQYHAFVGRIVGRTIAVIVIVSIIHDVPAANDRYVVKVEIWECHTVSEFMAECAEGSTGLTYFRYKTIII